MSELRHPSGVRARVLLTSVFGPYAQDDEYGSRSINPMELYHNQVTRVQGPFSLRMFHRSWGLMMIQANISAPSTLLDFPTLARFTEEIREHQYDIIGISSIVMNLGKVKKMCELIRQHQPHCTIVVGGHISNMSELEKKIDADHIVRGEGVVWMRRFLGEDDSRPVVHPDIVSGFGARIMGIPLRERAGDVAAVVIPSVGCPMGCNFCSTSALFGGKGHFVNFYESGGELFEIMCSLEDRLKVHSFFVMDENFLLYRRRALELLELMRRHGKAWSLYAFSSANALKMYSMDELVGLGLSWLWMGLEGQDSSYSKLKGTRTQQLVKELQSHGIRVLGSTIIGLESHTPENIDQTIDYAISHDTDLHQFMLYTPVPGTPLYAEHKERGTLNADEDPADMHGQFHFNFRHPFISREQSGEFLLRAFRRDFELNGPSIMRMSRTLFHGWKRHRNHPEERVRRRFRREMEYFSLTFGGAVWAMEKYFRDGNRSLARKIQNLHGEIRREFLKARILGALSGRFIARRIKREERRLRAGWRYEPPTFVERRNWGAVSQ
ncbi:MAG TPA: cobalamin-dependent protein [Acidobacteriota bacterium]|nr:cobalamin-dependent protein [Acidobacteriota bacterium]